MKQSRTILALCVLGALLPISQVSSELSPLDLMQRSLSAEEKARSQAANPETPPRTPPMRDEMQELREAVIFLKRRTDMMEHKMQMMGQALMNRDKRPKVVEGVLSELIDHVEMITKQQQRFEQDVRELVLTPLEQEATSETSDTESGQEQE